jgi:hypothetical protein
MPPTPTLETCPLCLEKCMKNQAWVNRSNRAGFYSNCFIGMPEGLTVEEMKRYVIDRNVSRYSKGIAELMEVV